VRSDAKGTGQLTRLFARVIVLERGGRKLALVSEDLNGVAGGTLLDAANRDADIGFSEQNVLDSASHTHAAEGGYFNFSTYNTVAPAPNSPTQLSVAFDPRLYGFLVERLALAIRRDNANLGPAQLGWGHTELLGVTENRSLEAHLANFGIQESPGTGNAGQDPGGYPGTVDPNVDVLRVDKLFAALPAVRHRVRCRTVCVRRRGRLIRVRRCGRARPRHRAGPSGNADHHGEAIRRTEDALRGAGQVPGGQDIVDVYGNGDAGDMSAGLHQSGPAAADSVGRREADAFIAAWHQAGASMTATPALDLGWTRLCFCGQTADGTATPSSAAFGVPMLTGSEEGRGPLPAHRRQLRG